MVKLKATLYLLLVFQDTDWDNTQNFLVRQPDSLGVEYSIAFSASPAFEWKNGYYKVVAECDDEVFALDPTPDALKEALPWGIPRRAPACNAISLEGPTSWPEKKSSSSH